MNPVLPEPKEVQDFRLIVKEILKGGNESPFLFGEFIGKLLQFTIAKGSGAIYVARGPKKDTFVINGWNGLAQPVPLNDSNYLRLAMEVFILRSDNFLNFESNRIRI